VTRLLCIGRYVNEPRGLAFDVGVTFEPDEALAAFLLADAPGCFAPAPAAKAVDAPARDKAIKTAQNKGGGVL
jgi:hypothetical protein